MVLLPPNPPAHGAVGSTRGALLDATRRCWSQPPPACSSGVILQVARGSELFSPASTSVTAGSSPQMMPGNETPFATLRTRLPPHSPSLAEPPSPSCHMVGVWGALGHAQPPSSWKMSALQPWLRSEGPQMLAAWEGEKAERSLLEKIAFACCQFSLPAKAVDLLAPSTLLAAAFCVPLCWWSP